MTMEQVINKTKTVTRRDGWWFLKPGDHIWAVEKSRGLKPGEKIKRLAKIRIVSTRAEPLFLITNKDCALEGFPHYEPLQFVAMITEALSIKPDHKINRIEFEYI